MPKAALLYDDRFLLHDTGAHPENAVRLKRTVELFRSRGVMDLVERPQFSPADEKFLEMVHTRPYINQVQRFAMAGGGFMGVDTIISQQSYEVAKLAAGACRTAVDLVLDGAAANAFCLVRPPGHHADSARGSGFCIFNNVALAARYALERRGLTRVLILDWDVHHGNGTEVIFYQDPRVLYLSIHQSPAYPGTGWVSDRGVGAGEGFNVNVPLPYGVGDEGYLYVMKKLFLPIALEFGPQLILVSAGQDCHFADYLGGMEVTSLGFSAMTHLVLKVAACRCPGKVVAVLEGGYNPEALATSNLAVLSALGGLGLETQDVFPSPSVPLSDEVVRRTEEVAMAQAAHWGCMKRFRK